MAGSVRVVCASHPGKARHAALNVIEITTRKMERCAARPFLAVEACVKASPGKVKRSQKKTEVAVQRAASGNANAEKAAKVWGL